MGWNCVQTLKRHTLFSYSHNTFNSQSKRRAPIGRTRNRCRRLYYQTIQHGSAKTPHLQNDWNEYKTARNLQSGDKDRTQPHHHYPLDQQLIEKAIAIVEDNINETEFSVEELASSLNISRSYFYKKMIKITGKKPIEFIKTIRMKRAQQLLTESQMQISEIAYILGYNSPKVFSKHFKDEFNISPSEFIRQHSRKIQTNEEEDGQYPEQDAEETPEE